MFSLDAVAGIRAPSRSGVVAIVVYSDDSTTEEKQSATKDADDDDSAIVNSSQHAPCLKHARWGIVRAGVISALTIRHAYCREFCHNTDEIPKHKLYGVCLGVLVAHDNVLETHDEGAQTDDYALVARVKSLTGCKANKTMVPRKLLPAKLPVPRECKYFSFSKTNVAHTCPSFDALCFEGKDFARNHGYLCGPMYESVRFQWTTGAHATVCALVKIEPFRIDCLGDNTAVTFISSAMPVTLHRMFI